MTLDHATVPRGRKTARRRGWRVTLLRHLATRGRPFTARDLAGLANSVLKDSMTVLQAQALCASYIRKGELRQVRRGIGGSDGVEALYTKALDSGNGE